MPPDIKRYLKRFFKIVYYGYRLNMKAEEPVIVYQMGKVGSSSISRSLRKQLAGPVFHVHRMNADNIRNFYDIHKRKDRHPPDETVGLLLNRHLTNKKPAKIISLVREPIERNISAFFQNHEWFVGKRLDQDPNDIDTLSNIFFTAYDHSVPLTWFDIEMKPVVGIDVYRYPFPFEKGYMIIKHPPYELLIIKLEVEDSIKEEAVKKFLKLDDFRLSSHNVGDDKEYALIYNEFKTRINIPDDYLERMCNARFTRHFYSAEEITAIREKWI